MVCPEGGRSMADDNTVDWSILRDIVADLQVVAEENWRDASYSLWGDEENSVLILEKVAGFYANPSDPIRFRMEKQNGCV